MSEWTSGNLSDVLLEVDSRNSDGAVGLVLSVTEGRGVVPQTEVFKKRIATADTTKYKIVQPLDIVWNPYLLWAGAIGQWTGPESGVTSPVYPTFRARKDQDPEFWGLVLGSGLLTPYFDSNAVGSIQRRRRTTLPVFENAPVLIPSRAEQRRIVDAVAAVNAHIDALAKEIAAATQSLGRARAEFPVSDEVPISSVLEGLDSGRSVRTAGDPPVTGVPRVLKLSAVQLGTFNADEAKRLDDQTGYTQTHRVREGDLLITRANTPERVGYVAVANAVPNDTYLPDLMWRIRPNESRCLPLYLSHLLSSTEIRARITATASGTNSSMQKINKKSFGAVRIPLPDTTYEQKAYVAKCEALAVTTRELSEELNRVRAVRSALLMALLNQEIEIPESYDSLLEEAT